MNLKDFIDAIEKAASKYFYKLRILMNMIFKEIVVKIWHLKNFLMKFLKYYWERNCYKRCPNDPETYAKKYAKWKLIVLDIPSGNAGKGHALVILIGEGLWGYWCWTMSTRRWGGGGSNACKYILKKLLIVQAHSNNPRNLLNGAGVATPDPGEAPLMAGFNVWSLVA